MYHVRKPNITTHQNISKWEAAQLVLNQVRTFYGKANIPIISERKAAERIIKLNDENAKLRAIPTIRRSLPSSIQKATAMKSKLLKTFVIWPSNVETLIKNAEDLAFLKSMKSDRSATFGAKDKNLANKINRKRKRQEMEEKRVRKEQERQASVSTTSMQLNSSDEERETDAAKKQHSSDDDCDATESNSQQKRSHHRETPVGTTAFVPPDILKLPRLVSLATRLKMSAADQACFTAAVVEEAGGDISKISSSYSSAARSRRKVVEQIASKYKEEWSPPKLASLHWDSKIMNSLSNRNITEERLVVIVGDVNNLQLLGVPHYPVGVGDSTGNIIANLTCNLLTSWRCSDSIVNMTFDTTASNTGHISAACVCIQNELKKTSYLVCLSTSCWGSAAVACFCRSQY